MVIREDRDAVVALIDRYTADEIGADAFDKGLSAVSDETEDETVARAAIALWGLYDDFVDHKCVASKLEWDYIQRLKLLLMSDGELADSRATRRLTWRQGAAWASLAAFAAILLSGWGYWVAALPAGICSAAIAILPARRRPRPADVLAPFGSLGETRRVLRRVPGFAKRRYRREIAHRHIREGAKELLGYHPLVTALMWLPWVVAWFAFAPVPLLFQAWPEGEEGSHVILPTA